MAWLLAMLATASILSGFAVLGLVLLPKAPPRLRLAVASLGLAVWLVPWPSIELPVEVPGTTAIHAWLPLPVGHPRSPPELAGRGRADGSGAFASWLALALVAAGLLRFAVDVVVLGGCVRRWRRGSGEGEALRRLLPAALRETPVEIRVVHGTRVAATSGWLRATIWIGDEFASEEDLRIALLHEYWHVRGRDPLWITLILAVRRVYFWNPLVIGLAEQAMLMIESACDRRCAESFGRRRYVERLAVMMLEADSTDSPRLAAAARGRSLNVRRLELLEAKAALGARDCGTLALLAVATVAVAGWQVSVATGARPDWSTVGVPQTPAGRALTALFDAYNGGHRELVNALLGAYTPEEVPWRLDEWTQGLELVEILASEPHSIEYVIEAKGGTARKIGRLSVVEDPSVRIVDAELRNFPADGRRGADPGN